MKENPSRSLPGILTLLGLLALVLLAVWLFLAGAGAQQTTWVVSAVLIAALALLAMIGLYMVEPNQRPC